MSLDRRPVSLMYCFSHNDLPLQQELDAHLSVLVKSGAIETWSYSRIQGGDPWREVIEQRLETAEIILLLLSSEFFNSPFCYEFEMVRALQRQSAREARVVPILVKECRWQDSPLAGLQFLPGVRPVCAWDDRDHAWELVTQGLVDVITAVATAPSSRTRSGARPFMINAHKPTPALLRASMLQSIREAFDRAQPPRIVCLHGMAATGKSRLAVEYAHCNRDHYRAGLFKISAQDEARLHDGFYEIATRGLHLRLNDPRNQADGINATQRWLDEHDGWLLIVDDVEDPALLSAHLPTGRGNLLVISRDDLRGGSLPIDVSISVREFSPEESLAFFRAYCGRDLPVAEEQAAREVAAQLGHLPMVLEQAAAYILRLKMSFAAYLQGLRARPREAIKAAAALDRSVLRAENEGGAAADLLRLSAFLDGQRISLDLFARGALQSITLALAQIEAPYELYEALAPLSGYALILIDPATGSYSINRLVQTSVRAHLSPEQQRVWAERAVRLVSQSLATLQYQDWPRHKDLGSQVRAAEALLAEWGIQTIEAVRLLNKAGLYLIEQGDYDTASQRYQQALDIWGQVTVDPAAPRHNLDRADALNGLGRVCYHQGRFNIAEAHFKHALALRREEAGPMHPDTATVLNNLALLYYHRDPNRSGLEAMLREALRIREMHLGEEHPYVAKTRNNLALYLATQGSLAEAEQLHQSALASRLRTLGSTHPDVAQSLSGLAQIDRARGDYDKAAAGYRKAQEIVVEALGARHPIVGLPILGMAHLDSMRGLLDRAREGYERALVLWRPLGPQHPLVARCLMGLGVLAEKQGQLQAARAYYEQALRIWDGTLAPTHPDVITCRQRFVGLAGLPREEAPMTPM